MRLDCEDAQKHLIGVSGLTEWIVRFSRPKFSRLLVELA
jgi:hypothetical protein